MNRSQEEEEELNGGIVTGDSQVTELLDKLESIRTSMLQLEAAVDLSRFGDRRKSAKNLLHYLALRCHDIRQLQDTLTSLGISSLGRSEGHVLYNLEVVTRILRRMLNPTSERWEAPAAAVVHPEEGRYILRRNTDALLGPAAAGRQVRIMVTMPSIAATDYGLVRDLVASGMDCMRINCAHDDKTLWLKMIRNLRRAEREVGRECRVLMDIAGPKLRTGDIAPGPQVIKWRPRRDSFGRVLAPARIWLTSKERPSSPPAEADATLQVARTWINKLSVGARVRFMDARGARRSIRVTERVKDSFWGESRRTSYVSSATALEAKKAGGKEILRASIENIPHQEEPIILKPGDTLVLSGRKDELGRPAEKDASGAVVRPARVSCTLPQALLQVRIGEEVWLDDGRIGGVVKSVSQGEVEVEIKSAAEDGAKLGADAGVNLPKTKLQLPALTEKDVEDLQFIARHADMLGYSFVQSAQDLESLRRWLKKLGVPDIGIILKIETRRAFEQLPSILLASMRAGVSGVMVARGDLAVECGYERLAEVQEEILWLCEAAHMPSIWASQVMERMAKKGVPSRAEVTDAAMGERAECVMLNKGAYVVDAVRALDDILRRMQNHQLKKRSMLRHLNIAHNFFRQRVTAHGAATTTTKGVAWDGFTATDGRAISAADYFSRKH